MDKFDLSQFFPFVNIDKNELLEIQNKLIFRVVAFENGDTVLSNENYNNEIGFIISGKCDVYHERSKENILLHSLEKNDTFGILTLFSDEEYPTLIVSKKRTKVLFIEQASFLTCLAEHSVISLNVMSFMAGRIQFLNKKIATLCGASVEDKVKQYLIVQMKEHGASFPFNASRASSSLNIGRASLYRALDRLISDDVISLIDKKIYVMRPEALKG